MFDVGGGELFLIVLLILLLFGPNKIPEIAKYFRKGVIEVKKAQQQFKEQINEITTEIDNTIKSETIKSPTNNVNKDNEVKE